VHQLPEKAALARSTTGPALRREWGDPDVVLLVVGRLIPRKGLDELLHTWDRLPGEERRGWRLVLAGDGPDGPALADFAGRAGLSDVVFTGPIDYSRIADYYAAADVLISPTLEDNWSLVVPEGMSTGLPVMCSIYNGCYPELVQEGRNGWRYDPLDECSALGALRRVRADRDRLAEMGRASEAIVSQHTPARAAEAILEACQIALQRRRGLARAIRTQ
jgi:glycosyltransferase involved in cell wall biosynthesis